MIRRTFIKKGMLTVAGGVLGTSFGGPLVTSLAARSTDFILASRVSLCVITDRPDEAIAALQTWFGGREAGLVRVAAHPIAGRHVGDVVLFRNGQLVDYRVSADPAVIELQRLASRHELPRLIDDPTMIRFDMGSATGRPTRADVYLDQHLTHTLPLSRDIEEKRIESEYGYVTVSIRNGRIRVVNASCRHKTCANLGEVGAAGQSLACIPARISITLDGQSSTDAITM